MIKTHRDKEEEMRKLHRRKEEEKNEAHLAEEERLGTEIRILNEKLESINIPVTFLPLSPAASNASDKTRQVWLS